MQARYSLRPKVNAGLHYGHGDDDHVHDVPQGLLRRMANLAKWPPNSIPDWIGHWSELFVCHQGFHATQGLSLKVTCPSLPLGEFKGKPTSKGVTDNREQTPMKALHSKSKTLPTRQPLTFQAVLMRNVFHIRSVTLEKKGTFFWEDHFSGAATPPPQKKEGKREPLNNRENALCDHRTIRAVGKQVRIERVKPWHQSSDSHLSG